MLGLTNHCYRFGEFTLDAALSGRYSEAETEFETALHLNPIA